MNIEDVKKAIDKLSFSKINLGHNVINFAKANDFDNWQNNFKSKANETSANTESPWQDSWFVMAKDSLEDPHFIDLKDGKIYTAINEQGDWFPVQIADNLEHYTEIITKLNELSSDRHTPEKLEKNPLSGDEIDELLEAIQSKEETDEDYHYWEYWLDE